MKVIVAGTRTIEDQDFVFKILDNAPIEITEVISGGANGPDFFGEKWAIKNKIPFKKFPEERHIYAISNWHVACQGSSVIRVDTFSGEPDIFDLGPEDWHYIPKGPDVAVAPVTLLPDAHPALGLSAGTFFLTDEL